MGTINEVRWWECHHEFLCSSLSGGEKCLLNKKPVVV